MKEGTNKLMMHLYSALLCISVHPKRFTITCVCVGGSLLNHHQCAASTASTKWMQNDLLDSFFIFCSYIHTVYQHGVYKLYTHKNVYIYLTSKLKYILTFIFILTARQKFIILFEGLHNMSTLGRSWHNGHIRAEFIPGVSVKGAQDLFPRLSCKACWNAIRCHINWCLSPQCGLHVRITRDE